MTAYAKGGNHGNDNINQTKPRMEYARLQRYTNILAVVERSNIGTTQ